MPYKFEIKHIKMPRYADRRIKITDSQRKNIKKLHDKGWAIRKISRYYVGQCSKRLITFIIYPERQQVNLEKRQKLLEEQPQRYYNREKHNLAMRKYRKYKQTILKGKI